MSKAVVPHRLAAKVALVVGILALVAYLPSLADGWVFDDLPLITSNEYVHALKWLPRAFATHLWDVSPLAVAGDLNGAVDTSRRYYRPIITVSHLLTWVAAGGRPWVFHLTNVIAHAIASWLATRAATRWTRSVLIGGAIGLVFALHPTRTENVLWVSGRMDVFMLLFGLLAIEGFRRFDLERRPRALVVGIGALLLALLSKEPAVMLPLVLLAERPRRSRAGVAIMLAVCGVYAIVRVLVLPPEGDSHWTFTPLAFVYTVAIYVRRAVLPWPPVMFYDQIPYENGTPHYPWPYLALGVLLIVGAVAALVHAWRRDRPAFWLLVASAAFLGPLLNVWFAGMKDIAQDRFLYAPLLLLLGAVGRLAKPPLQRALGRRAAWLVAVGLALAAIGVIELRTLDYADDDSFWASELAQSEHDPYVLRMTGHLAASKGDLGTALRFFRRARAPEAVRYENTTLWVAGHFEETAMTTATLPDGRVAELRALDDELYRAVDTSFVAPKAVVAGLPLGLALPSKTLERLQQYGSYRWDAALVATRIGDFARADAIVDQTNASRVGSNPMNGVLVLARLDRKEEARRLLADLRSMTSFSDLGTRHDYDLLAARLDRADAMAVARDAARATEEKQAYEALRLAELGAYWTALRALVAAHPEPSGDPAMLAVQLLVACRFDDAAGTYAERAFGKDAPAVLAKVFGDLPPAVRAMQPVPTPLDQVLAMATR